MRNRYVLLFDVLAFALAVCGAFALRFDLYFFRSRPEFVPYVLAAPAIKALIFYGVGIYRRFWRYASVNDLVALALADSFASVAMAAFVSVGIFRGFIYEFSRSVLIVDWILCLALTAAIRLCIRVVGESQKRSGDGGHSRGGDSEKRVLIVGAGDAGMLVAREMQRNAHLGMVPVGFVDDDPVKLGKRIYSLPVVASTTDLRSALAGLAVDEVIIAMPKAQGSVLRRIAEDCRMAGVGSRTIPGVFELLDGNVSVSRLRQVEITDLLRRRSVDVAPDSNGYVLGRQVIITGAGGSIGFELSRQVAYGRPRRLTLIGHGENSIFEAQTRLREAFPAVSVEAVIADVRDRGRLFRVFDSTRPDIIFHAAAHKHVPLMESNPEEAISNNVLGTKNVVDAAVRFDTSRFVMISSDKAVSPSSLMGASKRVAEAIVRAAAVRQGRAFATVRFGNVLGSRGSVVPAFKRQIETGGPITITHPDMKRFFMTIPEAVHLVLQAGGMARGGELFVLNMGEPLRIVQIAEDLIRLSGLSPDDIPIRYTGVRPGEKLEEQLWEDGASVDGSDHPEILRVIEPYAAEPEELDRLVEILATAAARADRSTIDAALRELIPTFSPIAAEPRSSQGPSVRH
jgi:FlaA1/EpsC-like NDP-sugar epimerase